HDPRVRPLPADARVEHPSHAPWGAMTGDGPARRRADEHAAPGDERLRLQAAAFAAVPDPGDFEVPDVAAIDLVEARVAQLPGAAAVGRPRAVVAGDGQLRRAGGERTCAQQECEEKPEAEKGRREKRRLTFALLPSVLHGPGDLVTGTAPSRSGAGRRRGSPWPGTGTDRTRRRPASSRRRRQSCRP